MFETQPLGIGVEDLHPNLAPDRSVPGDRVVPGRRENGLPGQPAGKGVVRGPVALRQYPDPGDLVSRDTAELHRQLRCEIVQAREPFGIAGRTLIALREHDDVIDCAVQDRRLVIAKQKAGSDPDLLIRNRTRFMSQEVSSERVGAQ